MISKNVSVKLLSVLIALISLLIVVFHILSCCSWLHTNGKAHTLNPGAVVSVTGAVNVPGDLFVKTLTHYRSLGRSVLPKKNTS